MAPRAASRRAVGAVRSRFVVLTGLSGAGKSQAIRALEDIGDMAHGDVDVYSG